MHGTTMKIIYANTFQKEQLWNVEYFNQLGSVIINYAIRTREIKSRVAKAKAAFSKRRFSPAN